LALFNNSSAIYQTVSFIVEEHGVPREVIDIRIKVNE